jgi:hypothetical protein
MNVSLMAEVVTLLRNIPQVLATGVAKLNSVDDMINFIHRQPIDEKLKLVTL